MQKEQTMQKGQKGQNMQKIQKELKKHIKMHLHATYNYEINY